MSRLGDLTLKFVRTMTNRPDVTSEELMEEFNNMKVTKPMINVHNGNYGGLKGHTLSGEINIPKFRFKDIEQENL